MSLLCQRVPEGIRVWENSASGSTNGHLSPGSSVSPCWAFDPLEQRILPTTTELLRSQWSRNWRESISARQGAFKSIMPLIPLCLVLVAAPGVLAFLNFAIENANPVLENASEHTRVAVIRVSLSRHASLVGDPVILNANPVVHPFALSRGSTLLWDLFTTGVPKLDFEMVALYSLLIYARDNQGATASQTISIQIADVNEPPTFTGSLAQGDQAAAEIYVLEDTALGAVIYRAAAKDPEDAALEYFLSPEGSGFAIDSSGTISTTAAFDFESETRSFSLVVKAVDPGGLFATGNLKIFLININNKDPTLTCSLFNIENAVLSVASVNSTLHNKVDLTLDEEIPVGKTIGTCQANDEDCLGDLTFELDPGNVYFAVDKERGTVVTATRLDAERAGFARAQSFSIKACDRDQRCAAVPVTAYIHGLNDNSPFCDQYVIRYTGREMIVEDTVVAKLSCRDLDDPPDTIHYVPSLGPVGSGQIFEQAPNAENVIRVTKELDYEDPEVVAVGHTYEMTISVFDDLHPSHTVTVTVIVELAPANDFSPVFKAAHYSFSVPETSGAFYKVGRVTATDEDHPPNCLTYKITNGDIEAVQKFWIHPHSGMIELTTQPDYESVKQYNLTVEAVDCDRVHPRTAVATVTVDIEDENDEAPVCVPSLFKGVISNNVAAGTNVNGFKLSCHDRDSQDFEMRFEIASGNENHHFGFDPTQGSNTPKLIVKNPFNFEPGAERLRQYHLVVHIVDDNLKHGRTTKPRTGTAAIDIYVIRAPTPSPPTSSEQRKGLTIVYTAVNTYRSGAWYIPFTFTLLAVFCVGLVSWLCFLLWRYGNIMECCQVMAKSVSKPMPREMKYIAGGRDQKEKAVTGSRSKKFEVLTETIVYETVFDGEAIDPVSGNVYEYNSRTGARKWKKPPRPQEEALASTGSLPEVHPPKDWASFKIPV
ncbi:cadherin-related family member 3 [Heterocephalus glaber]|uniref:Cadherin-related family member 3 n=1 Tax=Heterocephalus glaber TaxID=10181 RepID=A0AAX6S8L3_HETGA|nr:cadherin-related family member 3 [Heterocephalus glaber]